MKTPRARLLALETRLLDPRGRRDVGFLDRVLADDFREIGARGCEFGKATVLRSLPKETGRRFSLSAFSVRAIAPGCALATYRLREGARVTLRSSLWVRRRGAWRLAFHQGTPAAPR